MIFFKSFDLLFVANARLSNSALSGRCAVFFALLVMVVHLASFLELSGVEIIRWANDIYPLSVVENNRSFFGRRAGFAIIVAFPFSALLSFLLYLPRRRNALLARFQEGEFALETWRVALYTCLLVGALMASVAIFGAGSPLGITMAVLVALVFGWLAGIFFPVARSSN